MTVEILRRASNQSIITTYGNKTYIYRDVHKVDIRPTDEGQYVFSFVGKLSNDNWERYENVNGVADIYREVLE